MRDPWGDYAVGSGSIRVDSINERYRSYYCGLCLLPGWVGLDWMPLTQKQRQILDKVRLARVLLLETNVPTGAESCLLSCTYIIPVFRVRWMHVCLKAPRTPI